MAHFRQMPILEKLKSGAGSGAWLTVACARADSPILPGICAAAFAG
jgi:hypothetical protein